VSHVIEENFDRTTKFPIMEFGSQCCWSVVGYLVAMLLNVTNSVTWTDVVEFPDRLPLRFCYGLVQNKDRLLLLKLHSNFNLKLVVQS
jgi:hypothetical protein